MLTCLMMLTAIQGHPITNADYRATSELGGPVWAGFSRDGATVYQGQGPSIAMLDAQCLKACENFQSTGIACSDCLDETPRADFDASIQTAVEDPARQRLYVAGGDQGLWMVDLTTDQAQLIDVDSTTPTTPTVRWCFDVAVSNNRLVAVFGADDASELRVYHLGPAMPPQMPQLMTIVPLSTQTQPIDAGTAYAVELYRVNLQQADAYVAMGDGGLVRIANVLAGGTTAVQGPICAPCTPPLLRDHTIRDVAIVNGSGTNDFLYAAGDGYGLIEIKIGGVTWGSSTPFASGMPFDPACMGGANNYGYRLDAVLDAAEGRNVVALATDSGPVHSREWGPYTPYTGFEWNGEPPYSNPTPSPVGCDKRVYLYDRNPATWNPSAPVVPDLGPYGSEDSWGDFWRSLDVQIGSDGYIWVLNCNLEMEQFQRQGGVLTNVANAVAMEEYQQRDPSFGTGLLSLNDPDLIFFGRDTDACGWGLPKTIVEPNGSVTIKQVRPPSEDHAIVLLANGQWHDPQPLREWYLGGGSWPGDCDGVPPFGDIYRWFIYRFDLGGMDWKRVSIPFPVDPEAYAAATPPECVWDFPQGRGYHFTTVDPRPTSDLVALGRSTCINGAVLYSRSELMDLLNSGVDGEPVQPVQQLQKRTRKGLDNTTCYEFQIMRIRNMGMDFFEIWDGSQSRWALGVAAGWETLESSLDYQRPMLSFYDVTNRQTVPACADPTTGLPPDPLVVYGTPYPGRLGGFMFGFDTGIVGDRTFLFGADLAGQVLVFDVSDLFGTGGGIEVASWQTDLNLYDGLPDGVAYLQFVAGTDASDSDFKGWVYASASRLGLVRLRFLVDPTGAVSLDLDEIMNTPGQAAGFQIRDVGGDIRLILSDREDFGLRARSRGVSTTRARRRP